MTSRTASLVGIAVLELGCTVQSWRPSELQLDIQGAELSDTDRIRICVDGYGMREAAVGAGSVAFIGLPPDTELTITVDGLVTIDDHEDTASSYDVRSGRAGPVSLGVEEEWALTEWSDCRAESGGDSGESTSGSCEPCQTPGESVSNGDPSIVLAVRFID